MKKEDCFQLGYIGKPHALKGEVALIIDADEPAAYRQLESVFLEEDNRLVPYFIARLQMQQKRCVVKFEEIDELAQAAALSGRTVYLPLALLPERKGNTAFFYHEIIGFTVIDEKDGELGQVINVFSGPMQAVIAMEYQGKEVLIPLADPIIGEINRSENTLSVRLPDGLLDVYLES